MEVDFAISCERVMPTKDLSRACILAIGRSGIFEIDPIDSEVYDSYDLKHLKDIIRQEETGSVINSIRLIFSSNIEVDYAF